MELAQVTMDEAGLVEFTCRVCGETCPAPPGVPLDAAVRQFLDLHPACSDTSQHADGCPST